MTRVKRWTQGEFENYGRVASALPFHAVRAKTLLAKVYSEAYEDYEEAKANADLFAAAPKLVEALETLANQHKCGCGHPACNRCEDDAMAEDALRLAYGEGAK